MFLVNVDIPMQLYVGSSSVEEPMHSAPAASEAILGKRRIDGNSLATMITPKLLVK